MPDHRHLDLGSIHRRGFLKAFGAAGVAATVAGFPSIVRGQSPPPVKVGYLLPVTGPLAFEAQLALNGLLLAVDEINGSGGVKSLGGAKLALLPGDTQNKVELGNSEAARLIDQGAAAIIGTFSSLVAFSVRQVTEKGKTPFLLLACVADNLTEGGLRYTFRMQPNGKGMATLTVSNMLEMAKSANVPLKRVAIMHEDGNFGTTMGNHVEAFAKTMGYELVQRVPYNLRSARLHRRAVQGQGRAAGPPAHQRLLRRLQAHRRDRVQAPHRGERGGGPGQCRLLEPALHRGEPRAHRAALRRQLLAQPAEPAVARGVRRLPEEVQLGDVEPRRAGLPGRPTCSRTPWSGRRPATGTRSATRSAKTNLTDHILTQDAIRFDEAGEGINATPALLQVQNGQAGGGRARALRGGEAGLPGSQVEGIGPAERGR